MEVKKLPTVEELTAWMKVGADAIAQAEKIAETAYDVRQALHGVYTSVPVGIWHHGDHNVFLAETPAGATAQDIALVKQAVSRVGQITLPIDGIKNTVYPDGPLVKIAYSPFLRQAGEYLNFFPGKYPGGVSNSPSPVASMLTSGLVGGGLGYGLGWGIEQLYPNDWKKGRLRKTLGLLGGMAGAAPGAAWGVANKMSGRNFNDNTVLNNAPGAEPDFGRGLGVFVDPSYYKGAELSEQYKQACEAFADAYMSDALAKEAFEALADNRRASRMPSGPMAVNVDALGRTLWEGGADPSLAGMTMGAMAAAAQMPGGVGDPGWVTPWQMGELAAHMGAGYVSGAVVGHALGMLTGMPEQTQQTLSRTGMYAGLVQALVPKLFGQ